MDNGVVFWDKSNCTRFISGSPDSEKWFPRQSIDLFTQRILVAVDRQKSTAQNLPFRVLTECLKDEALEWRSFLEQVHESSFLEVQMNLLLAQRTKLTGAGQMTTNVAGGIHKATKGALSIARSREDQNAVTSSHLRTAGHRRIDRSRKDDAG